ncbi:transcription termination factor 1b, mitochondrial-like [Lithobates pipiens]
MALKILINISGHFVKSSHGTGPLNVGVFIKLLGRSCTQFSGYGEKKENVTQLLNPIQSNAKVTDMDAKKFSRRPSTIIRHAACKTHLEEFLLQKGASHFSVSRIILTYPKAISARYKDLPEVWGLWKSILKTDEAVLMVVTRSPESFFRSGGIEKLSENIAFFQSLGLSPKILHELMLKSPRTFANTVQLNKQMVFFFQDLCVRLGGENPDDFARQVITNNIFILTRSINRVKANIESIQSLMKLENKDLLSWIYGKGAFTLNLCNNYIEDNFLLFQQKMQSLGVLEADITRYIYENPSILLLSPKVFVYKIELLLNCGIEASKLLDNTLLSDVSLSRLRSRVRLLQQLDYDLGSNGPGILLLRQAEFVNWLKKNNFLYSEGCYDK